MSIHTEFHQAHLARLERIRSAANKKTEAEVECIEAPVVEVAANEVTFKSPWFEILDEIELPPRPISVEDIRRTVGRYFDIQCNDMLSSRKLAEVVYARHIAMYLAKTITQRSMPEIGRRLGGRDHTTILYGVRKIGAAIKTNWMIAYDVAHIEAML